MAGATVPTDSNGLATAPLLTANGTVGSFIVTASVPGVPNPATFSLTNDAADRLSLGVTPTQLSFTKGQVNQPAPAGQTVQVFSTTASPLTWTASTSASWLTVSSSSGTTPTPVTIGVNPAGLVAREIIAALSYSPPVELRLRCCG